jgi:hypothetical protein
MHANGACVGQRRCSPAPQKSTGVVNIDIDGGHGFQQARIAGENRTEAMQPTSGIGSLYQGRWWESHA